MVHLQVPYLEMQLLIEHVVDPTGRSFPSCGKLPQAYLGNVGADPHRDIIGRMSDQ